MSKSRNFWYDTVGVVKSQTATVNNGGGVDVKSAPTPVKTDVDLASSHVTQLNKSDFKCNLCSSRFIELRYVLKHLRFKHDLNF